MRLVYGRYNNRWLDNNNDEQQTSTPEFVVVSVSTANTCISIIHLPCNESLGSLFSVLSNYYYCF